MNHRAFTVVTSARLTAAGLGAAALAAATLTMPRTSSDAAAAILTRDAPSARRSGAATVTTPIVPVYPKRDPFAGDPSTLPVAVAVAAMNASTPMAPAMHVADLPSLAHADDTAARVHISATVTGLRPFAVAIDGGGTRVVTIGDILAGTRIAAIDGSGVHLADGTILSLSAAGAQRNVRPPMLTDRGRASAPHPMGLR